MADEKKDFELKQRTSCIFTTLLLKTHLFNHSSFPILNSVVFKSTQYKLSDSRLLNQVSCSNS